MEGLFKFRVRDFISSTLNHNNVGLISHIDEIKIRVFALFKGGVDDEFAVDAPNANGTNWASEWDIGNCESGRGTIHGEHIGIVFLISAQKKSDDLGVIEITLWEERTQRAVRHAAGQDLFFGRTTFALEVATRESSGSRGAFFVFHRKGEPRLALANFCL